MPETSATCEKCHHPAHDDQMICYHPNGQYSSVMSAIPCGCTAALCGIPDEEGCCVCVRPLGHPFDPNVGEHHLGIGFISLPLPHDVHPSFAFDVAGRRAAVDLKILHDETAPLMVQARDRIHLQCKEDDGSACEDCSLLYLFMAAIKKSMR